MIVTMAGRGLRERDCRLSIMQSLKFRARRFVSDASASGTSEKRFFDRSSDCSVFATGAILEAARDVSPFSIKLRCRRKHHLDDGSMPNASKSVVLLLGVISYSVDPELPEDRR